jgi:hemoglobin/transferrin/lactoferrin receptor protein
MRHFRGNHARAVTMIVGAAFTSGIGSGSTALAQQQPTVLPPMQVETKQKAKRTKAPPARAAQPTAPASPPTEQASAKAPVTVSGPPSIGTNTIDITSQDLERLNPTDIKGVFSEQPGILVGSSLPMSQKVYVNGFEETTLAVTVDGAIQNNKVFHHNGTNFIDPSLLKAVRVDAGVAPADAGFGALTGSIVYETKDVRDFMDRDGVGGFAKSQFNTNGRVFTNSIAAYGMSKGFEVLGYFNIGTGDNFKAGNGLTVGGTETDFWSGLGKIAYQAPSGDRFELSHERISDDGLRPYRANFSMPPTGPAEPSFRRYDIDRKTTIFNYSDATPEGWWDPKVVIAHSEAYVGTTFTHRFSGATSPGYGISETLNGKAENKFSFTGGNIIAGVDFNKREAVLSFPGEFAREKSDVVGAYAQARLEPIVGTRVSFGGRSDYQWFTGTDGSELNDGGLSGNASFEQDLIGRFLTFKAGYSHIWAGIALAENYIMNPAWDYSGGLRAATADNVNAGLIARYNGWTLEGTVFRSQIDDARVRMASRDVESEGFEVGVGYDWGHGFLRVKYANIRVTIDGQPADSDTGTYLATPVGDIITITGFHRFVGTGFAVGANAKIAPEYDFVIAGSPPYKGYKVFNAFVEYKPTLPFDLTLRLDVRNIFNSTYAERATYGQEWIITDNVTPLYEPGRSVILTATAKF